MFKDECCRCECARCVYDSISSESTTKFAFSNPTALAQLFIDQLIYLFLELRKRIQLKKVVLLLIVVTASYFSSINTRVRSAFRWTLLGIASSVGLGTGMHTFVLYLVPFIVRVCVAAKECKSIRFPRPPYPNDILCPPETDNQSEARIPGPIDIFQLVQPDIMFWGFGTALGELPPYFIGRFIRNPMDQQQTTTRGSLVDCSRNMFVSMINKIGFLAIVLCASIPNPFFDIAGITCGHLNISFWRFFTAVIIGKAIIKSHLQSMFVIVSFSEDHVHRKIEETLDRLPYFGRLAGQMVRDWIKHENMRVHKNNVLTSDWTLLSMLGICAAAVTGVVFVFSTVHALAVETAKRKAAETVEPCKRKNEKQQ